MKTFASSLVFATLFTIFGASSANAQSVGSISDYYNDYELYVAEYETNWYSIVTWTDGSVSEFRSYSQQGARDWALWLHLHLGGIDDIDIVSRVELGSWTYIDTFGTYDVAVDEAIEWEADGFETDIRAIRVNTIYSTPYKPISSAYSLKKK